MKAKPATADLPLATINDNAVGASRRLIGQTVQVCARGENRYHFDVVLPATEDESERVVTMPTSWLEMEGNDE